MQVKSQIIIHTYSSVLIRNCHYLTCFNVKMGMLWCMEIIAKIEKSDDLWYEKLSLKKYSKY